MGEKLGKAWSWSALRPSVVGGVALGNPMNLAVAIAVYASLSKELGLPLRFPGKPGAYDKLIEMTDSGLLASGRPGMSAWLDLREQGNATLQQAIALEWRLFKDGWPKPWPVVEASIHGWRLAGRLPDAVIGPDGAPCILALLPGKKLKDVDYGKRIPLFLQWALLRLAPELADVPVRIAWLLAEPPGDDAPWQDWERAWQHADGVHRATMRAQLVASVLGLLAMFAQAQQQPSAYFPKTASASKPNEAWMGGFNRTGERDYAPGYARLLAGELSFDDAAGQAALQDVVERIEAALALPLPQQAGA